LLLFKKKEKTWRAEKTSKLSTKMITSAAAAFTKHTSAAAAAAVAATTPCPDENKKRQRDNPVATTTTKKARRDNDDDFAEDDDDEITETDEDLETTDDDDDLEYDDKDDEDGDDDLEDEHEEVKDLAKEAKEQQQILHDTKTILPDQIEKLLSLRRCTPKRELRRWLAKAKFNEIKETWLIHLAALELLHFPMNPKNHVKAWRDKVFQTLRDCGMRQKVQCNPKKLKRMVLDTFPDLMEARGIFSRRDQSRVIGRHDDDTLPSRQARLEHIKKLATMAELSWIGDKSANGLLKSIENLKIKANKTKLDYNEKRLAVYKENSRWSHVMETDQAKEIPSNEPITSLPAGSQADFVVKDDQGGARLFIEAKVGYPGYAYNQFMVCMHRLFDKQIDMAFWFSVYMFMPPNATRRAVTHIVGNSIFALRDIVKQKSDNYALYFDMTFDEKNKSVVVACDLGKTAKKHFEKLADDCYIWHIQDEKKFNLHEIVKPWLSSVVLDEKYYATTSLHIARGNVGEEILQSLVEAGGAKLEEGVGLITGDKADRYMKSHNGLRKTLSSKTICNNGNNGKLRFPLTVKKGCDNHVPITPENACDLLGALRHGDFHKDWNAPKGAEFAALLFSKKTLKKLVEDKSANSREKKHRNRKFGEICNLCFDAGEFPGNTWFFDKDRMIIGDPRIDQLRGFFA
jgi:hypothetical protein